MEELNNRDHEYIKSLIEIITSNLPDENFGPNELADAKGLSQRKLSRRLRSITNQSISRFIREVRLQKALELLQKEDVTAAEVAYKVGFGSATYFNKCFHEYFGVPPGKVAKEDLKKFRHLTVNQGYIEKKRSRLSRMLIISPLIIVIAIIVAFFAPRLIKVPRQSETSIAVLPFRNDSHSDSTTYFVIGVEEAIRNNLQNIKAFSRVVSRTTTEHYRELPPQPLSKIAKELKVNYVIEGNALKHGNNLQLNIKLIRTFNEKVLWSKNFKTEINQTADIFGIENEIAQAIARQLETVITPVESKLMEPSTGNMQALDDFLKGEYYTIKSTKQDLEIALQYYKNALMKDSSFTEAYCSLAKLYDLSAQMGFLPSLVATARQYDALKSAYKIDSTSAEVHKGFAVYYMQMWNWDSFEHEIKKALSIDPNDAISHTFYAYYLILMGRSEESLQQISLAVQLDPVDPTIKGYNCLIFLYLKRYEDALKTGYEGMKADSTNPHIRWHLATTSHLSGKQTESLRLWKSEFPRWYPDLIHLFDEGYARGGYPGAFSYEAEALVKQSGTAYVSPGDIAFLYAVSVIRRNACSAWSKHTVNMTEISCIWVTQCLNFCALIRGFRFYAGRWA